MPSHRQSLLIFQGLALLAYQINQLHFLPDKVSLFRFPIFSDLWNNGSRFRGGLGLILFGFDIHAFPFTPLFLVIREL